MADQLIKGVQAKGYQPAGGDYLTELKGTVDAILGRGASKKTLNGAQLSKLLDDPRINGNLAAFVSKGLIGPGSLGFGADYKPGSTDPSLTKLASMLGAAPGGKAAFDALINEVTPLIAGGVPTYPDLHDALRTAFDDSLATQGANEMARVPGESPERLRASGDILYERLWQANNFKDQIFPGDQRALRAAVERAVNRAADELTAQQPQGGATA